MSSADKQPALLPEHVRQKLKAIVFDTNAFPRGQLRFSILTEWERRARLAGLEIWIPEPVLWELAEHAASAWEEHLAFTKRMGKILLNAGVETRTDSPFETRGEVISKIETDIAALGPTLRVLHLDGDLAAEALKDQILQRKPAKQKDGVKTGASDSAWLRQVLRAAYDDQDIFVIVGGDADVYSAFDAWGREKPWVVALENLRKALFVLEEPEASVVERVAEFLRNKVGSPLEGGRTPDGTLAIGDIQEADTLIDVWEQDHARDLSLVHLEAFAGLNQVKIDQLTGVVTAQVFLCPQVEYSGVTLDVDGTSHTHLVSIPDAIVRDVLSFTFTDGAVVKAASESGEARAFIASEHLFDGPEEAFAELLTGITLVPEVALLPGVSEALDGLEIGSEFSLFLGHRTLSFISEPAGEGWEATVSLSTAGGGGSLRTDL